MFCLSLSGRPLMGSYSRHGVPQALSSQPSTTHYAAMSHSHPMPDLIYWLTCENLSHFLST